MSAPDRCAKLHDGLGFRIKIAATVTGQSVAVFDEARAVTLEAFGGVPAKDERGDVLRDDFRLPCAKTPAFGSGSGLVTPIA